MQLDRYINNIKKLSDLKDIITENELMLLYSYVTANSNKFTDEEAEVLYEFFSQIDDKFLNDEQ